MSVTPFGAYKDTPSRWGMEDLAGVERNRTTKQVAKGAATAANIGLSSAQAATRGGALAMATGAAAVSATGVGLVVTGDRSHSSRVGGWRPHTRKPPTRARPMQLAKGDRTRT
jgi:hypothetical protein